MKYRYCFCYTICILLNISLICSLCCCKSKSPDPSPSGELSVVQIYSTIKDYDYWNWSFDGSVTALKGDKKISLQGEKRICDIQFIDGWIYYVKAYNSISSDFDIFRIRPNGEDSSVVLNSAKLGNESGSSFHSFDFVDGYMYVQMGFEFYRCNLQSGEITELDGDVSIYQILNNRLYFIGHARRDFTIYVMDLETYETEIVLGEGFYYSDKEYATLSYSNFIFIDDVMYYTRRSDRVDSGLYLTEIFSYENNESRLIDNTSDIDEFSLFEYEKNLYYLVRQEDKRILMQYSPSTKKLTKLLTVSDYGWGGDIVNDYFYYYDKNDELIKVKI